MFALGIDVTAAGAGSSSNTEGFTRRHRAQQTADQVKRRSSIHSRVKWTASANASPSPPADLPNQVWKVVSFGLRATEATVSFRGSPRQLDLTLPAPPPPAAPRRGAASVPASVRPGLDLSRSADRLFCRDLSLLHTTLPTAVESLLRSAGFGGPFPRLLSPRRMWTTGCCEFAEGPAILARGRSTGRDPSLSERSKRRRIRPKT